MKVVRRVIAATLRRSVSAVRRHYYRLVSDPIVMGGGRPRAEQPILFRGRGSVAFGDRVQFGWPASPGFFSAYAYIEARRHDACIKFGSDSTFNNGFVCIAFGGSVHIGSRVLGGPELLIMNSDFHSLEPESRLQGLRVDSADVSIGNNVFIGARVTILKGAQIGDDSVIAAGSVVSGAFPPRVLLAGNPAVVKRVFEPSK